jgi:rhodanese-related sulfurtransferase
MFSLLTVLKSVSPRELHRLIERHEVMVLDVNSAESWRKSHVPGAVRLDPQSYRADDLPTDRSVPLVFYCSNPFCRKAPTAARRAQDMGYTNVRIMRAGITGWLATKLPVESGDAPARASAIRRS